MKKFLLITLVITAYKLFAQNYLVEYDVRGPESISKTELIFNDSFALFNTGSEHDLDNRAFPYFVKNNAENASYSSVKFMNVSFNVRDSLNAFKWELLADTMTILNQKCLSAKTDFRGRSYIAYYSPAYVTAEGPWKFGGLPGLILDVKSTDNYVEYKAVKIIENYAGKMETVNLKKYKFLEWNDFVADYKSTVTKYIKLARSSGAVSDGSSAFLKLIDVEIFYPELQTGNGIKF